ncbi:MAG TPA: alpha/beta fold hydrolase [Ramlibacter sp.]|uniref:esterase/lipase family protein n=1 Tax=Ramlibacter sp. TaxID=1917967 RepID=UPI002ED1BC7A
MPGHSRLARLLQWTCAIQLGAAVAWLAWRWTASPVQAIAGALSILLIAPIVLGLELCIVAVVARTDHATPIPAAAQLLRAWLSESAYWYRTFCWRQPFRWNTLADQPSSASQRTGVVLVHGFMCNRGFWTPWMRMLRQRGHPYVAVNLEPVFTGIEDYARTIDDAVCQLTEATRSPPVLVCHSMGGLAARAWWRSTRGNRSVARIVTIGTPHRGTWLARFSRRPNGRQMQLQSAWLEQLSAHEAGQPLPVTTCWYSNCDNVVFPASTATLPLADNRFVPGRAHVDLAFDETVMRGTLALLTETSSRRQGESVTGSHAEIG